MLMSAIAQMQLECLCTMSMERTSSKIQHLSIISYMKWRQKSPEVAVSILNSHTVFQAVTAVSVHIQTTPRCRL